MAETISHDHILKVIDIYAQAYAAMESIQELISDQLVLIPKGDQKTGCIGEYWAMRYARRRWGDANCAFGSHSQHGWDIMVEKTDIRIQVKTVSAWSNEKRMSKIDPRTERRESDPPDWAPWTLLWLIYVDRNLQPTGFWQIKRFKVDLRNGNPLKNQKIRLPDNPNSGTARIAWPDNTVHELLQPEPAC